VKVDIEELERLVKTPSWTNPIQRGATPEETVALISHIRELREALRRACDRGAVIVDAISVETGKEHSAAKAAFAELRAVLDKGVVLP